MGLGDRHSAARRRAWTTLLVVAPVACGGEARPEARTIEAAPAWEDADVWRVDPTPTLSIGVLEGADEYQFDDVSAGAVLPDGRIVVADVGAARVRVYGSDGAFLEQLGGPGDGPGEFRMPVQVVPGPDGAIDVWDGAAWRRTRFDADGSLVEVRTTGLRELSALIEPPRYPAAGHLLADGSLIIETVVKGVESGRGSGPGEPGDVVREERLIVHVSADLTAVRDRGVLLGEEQAIVDAMWGPQPMRTVLRPRPRIASVPGGTGYCLGDQSEARVRCDAGRTIAWSSHPRTFDPDDVDLEAWRDEAYRQYADKIGAAIVDELLDQVPLPEVWPAWSELHLDRSHNAWVGEESDGATRAYRVFEPDGTFLGRVALPLMGVLEIGEDYVLGVRRDDVDVQHVQLFTIDKP